MSKDTKIIEDPSIKRSNKEVVLWAVVTALYTILAFTTQQYFLLLSIKIGIWLSFLLSIGVGIAWVFLEGKEITNTPLHVRIDSKLLYPIVILRMSTLVIFSTFGWVLPMMYVVSQAVLGINYIVLLERKDKAYTKKMTEPAGIDNIRTIFRNLLGGELKKYGTKNHHKKEYWDVDEDDK